MLKDCPKKTNRQQYPQAKKQAAYTRREEHLENDGQAEEVENQSDPVCNADQNVAAHVAAGDGETVGR
ncbi:hypothetical protein PR003_g15808 [Phytophthora rubi]|uniref:Uncharacterized protein n=1 Tax=Phytophthora rubi TaxID=129364 RepID=A0A6A4ELR3_9STRA|nr:hypothetical protein PR001_g17442 [Phytophthora rubi]KAE9008723.1 hypothetical protein PR002_g15814 [Phytophthora rubi]KAE9328348.1 hypothetical protein PR003_g15808 [Phytophthora rubi]